MRLWSIHPKYLDSKGLVALWREALLAQKVLLGKTIGYQNHPQLERFRIQKDPVGSIVTYLFWIHHQARQRGYDFDKGKILPKALMPCRSIKVTKGQIAYEFKHLVKKLKVRDKKKCIDIQNVTRISLHPLFYPVAGDIETWEKLI